MKEQQRAWFTLREDGIRFATTSQAMFDEAIAILQGEPELQSLRQPGATWLRYEDGKKLRLFRASLSIDPSIDRRQWVEKRKDILKNALQGRVWVQG